MATILTTLVIASAGWVAILIVGQPVIRFFDLRRDVREQMLYSDNVAVPKEGESAVRFEEAHYALRRLGAKMLAFSETTIAAPMVSRLGYDPSAAGSGLIGFSNELGTYGEGRARFRAQVEQALKFPS
jgi:hypothetical protein